MPSNHRAGCIYDTEGIAPTIMGNHGYPALIMEETQDTERLIQVGQIYNQETNPTAGRVYDANGISPTLTTPTGGNSMPLIAIKDEEMNSRLLDMLEQGKVPLADGMWIDSYNKIINRDVAGTLRTTIDSANMHYIMEQIPFNTAEEGLAYTVTTRYGAMCASNLIDGNFPMTGILEIENPTDEMKQQIADGRLNFDKGMPKTCAVRGRGEGEDYRQQLEIGDDIANALTTVQKDSMVAEEESDPSIICLMPWNNPGGDKGGISPSITTSAWEHNNFVKIPESDAPMVMTDPRKNYGRIQPSAESSPTLLSSDYKSPHLVMEAKDIPAEVAHTAEALRLLASASRQMELGMTINPDYSLRPHKLNKAKDGISEYCTDYDESIGSTNISARPNNVYGKTTRYRIRKLTPRECY